jgi:hypothetical protein
MAGRRSGIVKGGSDYFLMGSWSARCDQCYRKVKAGELLLEWDNLRVCSTCWDPRHPQELVRAITDPKPIPWSRPDPPAIFIQPDAYYSSRSFNGAPCNYQSVD